jgi:uncharacterized protein (DUF427 family)
VPGAAFRPDEPELAHLVFLDFVAVPVVGGETESVGHPRDPFHRIDVRPVEPTGRGGPEGRTLASSDRAMILNRDIVAAALLLPREDVSQDLLEPSDHKTTCAYKGHATT